MVYKFREGHSAPVPAQTIGETLEAIAEENDGDLSPKIVVEESRPENAPLHPVFEWDDEIAAEMYREDQARSVIRSVAIVREEPDESGDDDTPPERIAYVSIGSPTPGGARYVASDRAMSDKDMRNTVLESAIALLRGIKARYGQLTELAEVFAAIDSLEVTAK